jgi:hypothetical protein
MLSPASQAYLSPAVAGLSVARCCRLICRPLLQAYLSPASQAYLSPAVAGFASQKENFN